MIRASASSKAVSSLGSSSPSTPVPSDPTGESSDLGDLGRSAEAVGQVPFGPADLRLELLDRPWWADHPAEVAELPLHLALHGHHGVGQERDPHRRVEVPCRLDQRHRRRLHQVLLGDAAAAVLRRDRPGKSHVQDDHLVLEPFALHRVGLACRARQETCADRRSVLGGDGPEEAGAVEVVVCRRPLSCNAWGDHISASPPSSRSEHGR
jgi:hypothetical protein